MNLYFKCTKISSNLTTTIQNISCVAEPLVDEEGQQKIPALFNSISVFDQMSPAVMSAEQQKHPVLDFV